jgi:hypothetical protein
VRRRTYLQEAKVGGRSAYAAELELQVKDLTAHAALLREEATRQRAAAAEPCERIGELEAALARKQAEVGLMAQLMQARPRPSHAAAAAHVRLVVWSCFGGRAMDAVCSAQASKAEHDDTMAELQACATTGPAGLQGDGGRERGDQAEDSES